MKYNNLKLSLFTLLFFISYFAKSQGSATETIQKLSSGKMKLMSLIVGDSIKRLHFNYPDNYVVMPKTGNGEIIGLSQSVSSNFSIKVFIEELPDYLEYPKKRIFLERNYLDSTLPEGKEILNYKNSFYLSGNAASFIDYKLRTEINNVDTICNVFILTRMYIFIYNNNLIHFHFTYVGICGTENDAIVEFSNYKPAISFIANTILIN